MPTAAAAHARARAAASTLARAIIGALVAWSLAALGAPHLAAPSAAGAEEPDLRVRLAVVRPEGHGLQRRASRQRLEGEIVAVAGGLYGGMRGQGDEVMGADSEAVVYAGYRREPGGSLVDLSYKYRLGVLGRDASGRIAVDMDRQLALGMSLGARVHFEGGLDSGGAMARARFEFGPETSLNARVEQPIGWGGIGDMRARVRLERRFSRRDARLGFELSQASAPPRAAVSFRLEF